MVGIQGGSGGGGFDYVQDPSPQDPSEGEEWFDTGSDRAFVYNGSAWVEMTIGDHDQLSGVGESNHHSRPDEASQPNLTEVSRDTLGSVAIDGMIVEVDYYIAAGEFNNWSVTVADGYGNSTELAGGGTTSGGEIHSDTLRPDGLLASSVSASAESSDNSGNLTVTYLDPEHTHPI